MDYIMTTPKLMQSVRYFKVFNDHELIDSELSDHYPLLASLKFSISKPTLEKTEMTDIPLGYKWDKNSNEKFKAALSNP